MSVQTESHSTLCRTEEEEEGKTRQKLHLTCITSREIHIWNSKSISRKTLKKSSENIILAKGINSCKIGQQKSNLIYIISR